MEEIVDICDLMNKLVLNNVTPEDMIGCALRNLHSVESAHTLSRWTNLPLEITFGLQLRMLSCYTITANR